MYLEFVKLKKQTNKQNVCYKSILTTVFVIYTLSFYRSSVIPVRDGSTYIPHMDTKELEKAKNQSWDCHLCH